MAKLFSVNVIRRPKAARRVAEEVRNEVRTAYKNLAEDCINKLDFNVLGWEKAPKFASKISVTEKEWQLSIGYDPKTDGGMHYLWADKGTGERGGGDPYEIVPKNKKGHLVFTYPPHIPKTFPIPAVPGIIVHGLPRINIRKKVTAPGIYPRNFSKNLTDFLKKREQVGGLRSVTEAAIKRAFRTLGIYDRK